jgi:hypothetical protein
MSQQTDELLLLTEHVEDEEQKEQLNSERLRQLALARERMRLLQDLQMNHGFALYIKYLRDEAKAAFHDMSKMDNPIDLARTVGIHNALTNAAEFVQAEVQRMKELITNEAGT